METVVGMGVDDILNKAIEEQNRVLPCLYTSRISAQTNRSFKGSAVKGGYCQGFHQVALWFGSEWTLATGT
jgi:hypothetical protein